VPIFSMVLGESFNKGLCPGHLRLASWPRWGSSFAGRLRTPSLCFRYSIYTESWHISECGAEAAMECQVNKKEENKDKYRLIFQFSIVFYLFRFTRLAVKVVVVVVVVGSGECGEG
jgi:hypothetical protein